MKYLYYYAIDSFREFVSENKMDKWCIYDRNIDERFKNVEGKNYVKELLEMAQNNEVSFDKKEVISWLDGIAMIYKSMNWLVDDNINSLKNLTVIGELHIPYSNSRADCVLLKDNKILIIEFSYKANKSRKEKYEEKLNQVMYYKELLLNALPNHIEIATYSFPIEIEADSYGSSLDKVSVVTKKKEFANYDSCYYLAQFIGDFFSYTQKNALEELKLISDDKLISNVKKRK